MNTSIPPLRIVREADEPLGLFFRPGPQDHTVLKQLLSEGQAGMHGVVFDPCHLDTQEELKNEILRRNLDAILDPAIMELATPIGCTSARKRLPWAAQEPHLIQDFDAAAGDKIVDQIATFAIEHRFTAVLAPTHYLGEGTKDGWLATDKRLLIGLRQRLDSQGGSDVAIHYPLALSSRVFADAASRISIKASLTGLPLNSIWLRIHPFGSDAGAPSVQNYIRACQDLHGLQIPLIAEKTGTLGLALLGFGAVAGIENGISSGEKFDYLRLKRTVRSKGPFARAARVYIPDLGLFLTRNEAKHLFENRGARQFACRNTACCRHSVESLLREPRRHYAFQRMGEVSLLSTVTPTLRPGQYLEQFLRPATDKIGRAIAQAQISDELKSKLEKSRVKQDGWRATLGDMSRSFPVSFSAPIDRRIRRARASA